jgi:hypothetical protein
MATIGGVLLIIGAWFTFKGQIYKAVLTYFLADLCWVFLAFQSGDVFGGVVVLIGMGFGLGAFYKMNSGKMEKELRNF